MDLISTASILRQQLVALETSDNNIRHLGYRLETLGGECAKAEIADNQFQQLRSRVRLSVYEGVHRVYQQYSDIKLHQVQATASSIKSSIETGSTDPVTSPLTASSRVTSVPDKAAAAWSSADMELYRRD